MRRVLVVTTLLASVLVASGGRGAALPLIASAGNLDPTWSSADLPNGGQQLSVSSATATQDGALIVVTNQGLMRLSSTGHPDLAYGAGGKVTLPFSPTWIGTDDADSDVVVVGTITGSFRAARVLPSGQLDGSYGTGGTVDLGPFGAFPSLDGGRLLLQSGSPPAIERLTTGGSLDPSFGGGHPVTLSGHGAPGPIVRDAVSPDRYDLATDRCAPPDVCPFDLVQIGLNGTVMGSVPVASAPEPGGEFGPEAISNKFQIGDGLLVAGSQADVLVRPDGTLDPAFGQGRCGDPGGAPTMPGGTLHVLTDGRTLDLTTPGDPSSADLYDIVPHAFVRSFGRKDPTFGAGGHIALPTFTRTTVFLTSTQDAVWFALENPITGGSSSIIKVLLTPAANPEQFGPPATYGDWLVGRDGGILSVPPLFGFAPEFCGSMGATPLAQPVVGGTGSPDGVGYWLVASDGGVFSFGDAVFFGSTGAMHLNQPVVGMAPTPDGHGYWLVARDGGVFAFGDATFFGSTGSMHLNAPIVGMAATADGRGYWLVAADGGIFTFGDAAFLGSTGSLRLNAPIIGMLRTRSGDGYWLAARDGGIFTFGDAGYGDVRGAAPVVAIAPGPPDTFTVVSADGRVRNSDFGSFPQPTIPAQPIVGIISQG